MITDKHGTLDSNTERKDNPHRGVRGLGGMAATKAAQSIGIATVHLASEIKARPSYSIIAIQGLITAQLFSKHFWCRRGQPKNIRKRTHTRPLLNTQPWE